MSYSVSFSEETLKELDDLALKLKSSRPEVIAKALKLAMLYADIVVDHHGKLIFEDALGNQEHVKFL